MTFTLSHFIFPNPDTSAKESSGAAEELEPNLQCSDAISGRELQCKPLANPTPDANFGDSLSNSGVRDDSMSDAQCGELSRISGFQDRPTEKPMTGSHCGEAESGSEYWTKQEENEVNFPYISAQIYSKFSIVKQTNSYCRW